MKKRKDVSPIFGMRKYGEVKFADNTNKKYPIDTPEHIRAAWNYIHMPRDFEKYSEHDRQIIKQAIINAWKEQIDSAGPPKKDEPL